MKNMYRMSAGSKCYKGEKEYGGTLGWGHTLVLTTVIGEDLTDKKYSERPKGGEGVSHVKIWER